MIRDVINNRVDLHAGEMYIARAHRLGQRNPDSRKPRRHIIVNFRDYLDTENIMAHMLRNTPVSVDHDLPKEIQEARK